MLVARVCTSIWVCMSQSTITLVATHACENLWTIKIAIRIKWSGVEINGNHKKIIMCHFYSFAFYAKPNSDRRRSESTIWFYFLFGLILYRMFAIILPRNMKLNFFTSFHDRECTWPFPFVYMSKTKQKTLFPWTIFCIFKYSVLASR